MSSSLLLSIYREASSEVKERGLDWYPSALNQIKELESEYRSSANTGPSCEQIAGALAALSVQTPWEKTLSNVRVLLDNPYASMPAITTQRYKAEQILFHTKPDEYLRILKILGPDAFKTKAFFRNLLGSTTTVAVDRHMLNAMGLSPDSKIRTKQQYQQYAREIIKTAKQVNINPPAFQATIWLIQKESK